SPLYLYLSVVMTRAGRAFCFSSSESGSCQPPTRETTHSRWLSGDQTGPFTPFLRSVRRGGSPPSAGMTYSCPFFFVSRSESNARRRPGGGQRGAGCRLGPAGNRRGVPPGVATIQICERYSSFSSESVVKTKATRRPFGEIWGSLTQAIRVMSWGFIGRGAP